MNLGSFLRPFVRRHGGILCFHGLRTPSDSVRTVLHVDFVLLRQVIEAVRAAARIVSVKELTERSAAGESVAGLVAITFDDAYASLLDEAIDFVATEGIPVTVFAVSDAARSGKRFWWDRLDALDPGLSNRQRLELVGSGPVGAPADRDGGPKANLLDLRNDIVAHWKGRLPATFEEVLTRLEEDCGLHTSQRSMTFEEIDSLLEVPFIDVGVHTCTHPVLPLLDDAEIVQEIRDCHRILSARLDRVLPVLAIPFGLYDHRTARLAGEAGMVASLSLSSRTLRYPGPKGMFSRFTVSQAHSPWRLLLKMAGFKEFLRLGRGPEPDRYPSIP